MADVIGVLLMAYGTPASLTEVEGYYTHIRRGKPPTKELLAELVGRYEAIGGCSPLNDITREEARLLEETLNASAGTVTYRVYVGMKHCQPFIGETVKAMAEDGVRRAVGIVLAPHFSAMSVGVYIREAQEAALLTPDLHMTFVREWHLQPPFLQALEERLQWALEQFSAADRARLRVVFSAHSLPERILAQQDPYPQQLLETSQALADRLGITDWQFGWQSAGRTAEPWLGPDILAVMEGLANDGYRAMLSCPVGFVSDHLEILYDLDIEALQRAKQLGVRFVRTPSLNTDHGLISALANAIKENLNE